MLKTILKTIFKVFVAMVVVRLGIFAAGMYVATDGKAVSSLRDVPSMKELRTMSRDGVDAISQLLNR